MIVQVLRLLSLLLSFATVPFASYLCITFIKEKMQSNFIHLELNQAMQLSTFLIAFGSLLSGVLSFLLLIGYDFEAHLPYLLAQMFFNSRNIIFSLGHLVLCTVLVFEHRKMRK